MDNKIWNEWLENEKKYPYFKDIVKTINKQDKDYFVFPAWEKVFRPLEVDIEKVDVVITDTRPVGIPVFADGLAYSSVIEQDTEPIIRLNHAFYKAYGYIPNHDKALWHNNGIMLINRELTSIRESGIYPHGIDNLNVKWKPFTRRIIQRLLNDSKDRVFILADNTDYSTLKNNRRHKIFFSLDDGFEFLKRNNYKFPEKLHS